MGKAYIQNYKLNLVIFIKFLNAKLNSDKPLSVKFELLYVNR